ncbi:hypothetical protein D3C87_1408210 [compost metagenome]
MNNRLEAKTLFEPEGGDRVVVERRKNNGFSVKFREEVLLEDRVFPNVPGVNSTATALFCAELIKCGKGFPNFYASPDKSHREIFRVEIVLRSFCFILALNRAAQIQSNRIAL